LRDSIPNPYQIHNIFCETDDLIEQQADRIALLTFSTLADEFRNLAIAVLMAASVFPGTFRGR